MAAVREITVVAEGYHYLEGPRWRDGRLYASDFYLQHVTAFSEDGTAETVVELADDQPSGLGWLPDGRLLIAAMLKRQVLRVDADGVAVHADLSGLASWHLNDMLVDRQGRAYVGNFGFDLFGGDDPAVANLVRVDPDGSTTVVADELYFPNGAAITPDEKTFILAESFAQRITAFDIDGNGSLANRRVWAELGDVPTATDAEGFLGQIQTAPDGICLDEEGCIWYADGFGQRVVRVREGGEIVEEIPTEHSVFACMLGGSDGRTLFMCSAPTAEERVAKTTDNARLLACRVDVARAGQP